MNRYANVLMLAGAAAIAGCEAPQRVQTHTPLPANFAAMAPAADGGITPFPLLTGPSPYGVPLDPVPGLGSIGLAPVNPWEDLSGAQIPAEMPPEGDPMPQPMVAGEAIQAPGIQTQPDTAPANPTVAPDALPMEQAAAPVYVPVYVPPYAPQYVPQVIVVEPPPQVIVQQEYIPFPIFQSVFVYDHRHGHDWDCIEVHDRPRSRPAVIVGQIPRHSSHAQPGPIPVAAAPGGKMVSAPRLVNDFAPQAGAANVLLRNQAENSAARLAAPSAPTRTLVTPTAQRAAVLPTPRSIPIAQPNAVQPNVARSAAPSGAATQAPVVLPTKAIAPRKTTEAARSAPKVETAAPVRTSNAPPVLRAAEPTIKSEKAQSTARPALVNKAQAPRVETPSKPMVIMPPAKSPEPARATSRQETPVIIKPIAPTVTRTEPVLRSAPVRSQAPVVREAAPAVRQAAPARPQAPASSGGNSPIIPSKGAVLNRGR